MRTGNDLQILLVDDDPGTIQLLSRMVPDASTLRFATSGQAALTLAEEWRPDLVLLDAEMPGLSGLDVCKALKANEDLRDVPVIFVTQHDEPEFEAMALAAGAVDFISKPLVASQVMSRVQARLRQRAVDDARKSGLSILSVDDAPSRLLIVDDDISAIHFIHKTLSPLSSEIRFACSGTDALRMLAEQTPDLVLLDAGMPDPDGFEVCRQMQLDPILCKVPVIFITHHGDAETESRALNAGATDFITKPYTLAVLQARVRNVLRLKRQNDAALRALADHWQRLGEARVADVVAAASDGVICLDFEGRIVLINAAATAMFSIEAAQVIGRDLTPWLPDVTNLLGMPVSSRTGHTWQVPQGGTRLQATRGNGETFMVELTVSRLGEGEQQITTLMLRDATERDRREADARARLEAETANRTKTMMLAYMAHEIGNPLNGILGFAQVMKMDTKHPLPPEQAERLKNLLSAARHLQVLIRDVLDFSRFDSGRLEVKPRAVNAVAAITDAMQSVANQAIESQVRLEFISPDESLSVLADEERLHQCMLNLLTNGIKYNRTGGKVVVSLEAREGRVYIAVADTGLGMSQEQCAHLFEPFNRLGRGTSPIRGTGLGLALTRVLVSAMGGDIRVTSELKVGSCFALDLPAA